MKNKSCENNQSYYQEFNNYLRETLLEPNKLSETDIQDLCLEYLYWVDYNSSKNFIIKTGILADAIAYCDCRLQYFWEQLVDIINQYTKNQNNIHSWAYRDLDFNPVKDLKLMLPFDIGYFYHRSGCGSLNMRFYKLIYYFDFCGIPIQDENLKRFWKFYKKTMKVYAMGLHHYSLGRKEVHVVLKPDEIYIQDDVTHCIYDGVYYCDGVSVPQWLYKANKNSLDINDFKNMQNADFRSIFIKKAGIENFIEMGDIIDSYENYPENEWWAKSEYKLIDMKKILAREIKRDINNEGIQIVIHYDYAPFLFMKNQTTGEYHLEGVSPNCRDLYDAIKMRYKGLDLPSYEIQDIK